MSLKKIKSRLVLGFFVTSLTLNASAPGGGTQIHKGAVISDTSDYFILKLSAGNLPDSQSPDVQFQLKKEAVVTDCKDLCGLEPIASNGGGWDGGVDSGDFWFSGKVIADGWYDLDQPSGKVQIKVTKPIIEKKTYSDLMALMSGTMFYQTLAEGEAPYAWTDASASKKKNCYKSDPSSAHYEIVSVKGDYVEVFCDEKAECLNSNFQLIWNEIEGFPVMPAWVEKHLDEIEKKEKTKFTTIRGLYEHSRGVSVPKLLEQDENYNRLAVKWAEDEIKVLKNHLPACGKGWVRWRSEEKKNLLDISNWESSC